MNAMEPIRGKRPRVPWLRRLRGLLAATAALGVVVTAPGAMAATQPKSIDDMKVTHAVEDRLRLDPTVLSARVDVRTQDGVVTLTGTVDNLRAKRAATRLAATIKGVRSVVNRVEVTHATTSPDAVKDRIKDALFYDPATDGYQVDVTVDESGAVTLKGQVETHAERQLVERNVAAIRGVTSVDNRLTLKPGEVPAAFELKSRIEELLAANKWVDDGLVDVDVDAAGMVTLTGHVGSAIERRRAISSAWIPGVTGVNAEGLTVQWWARDKMRRKNKYAKADDDEIARSVKDAMLYDPRVVSFNPDVAVTNGVVTLTGTVDSLAAKRAAEKDARNTIGVWSVRNYLKVRTPKLRSDSAIVSDVLTAIERDPLLHSQDIAVTSINGHVRLYGVVDSGWAREAVEDIAARAKGVVEVSNLTQVVDASVVLADDIELARDVKDQLWWSPFVDADDVKVQVEGGIVTLRGTVDTYLERRYATSNALDAGADTVINRLAVRYGDNMPTGR